MYRALIVIEPSKTFVPFDLDYEALRTLSYFVR